MTTKKKTPTNGKATKKTGTKKATKAGSPKGTKGTREKAASKPRQTKVPGTDPNIPESAIKAGEELEVAYENWLEASNIHKAAREKALHEMQTHNLTSIQFGVDHEMRPLYLDYKPGKDKVALRRGKKGAE